MTSPSRYARRVDGNHAAIKTDLRAIGATVVDTSAFGEGFPDLVVGWRGVTYLVEIKDGSKPPSRRQLTGDQQVFFAEWRGGPLVKVKNVHEALAIFGARSNLTGPEKFAEKAA